MKKIVVILLVLALGVGIALYFMSPTKGGNELTKHVPEDAGMLMTFDLVSLAQKGELKNYEKSIIWKKMQEEFKGDKEFALLEKIAKDPSTSGVDFTINPQLFIQPIEGSRKPAIGMIFKLADKAKFADRVTEMKDNSKEVKTIDGINYLEENNKNFMLWNDEMAVGYFNAGDAGLDGALKIVKGGDKSIQDNEHYKNLKHGSSDFEMFMNYESWMKLAGNNAGMISSMPSALTPTDMGLVIHVNFEKGKVTANSDVNYGEKSKQYAEIYKSSAKGSLLGKVAAKDPVIAAQFRMNFQAFFDMLMGEEKTAKILGEAAENMQLKRDELRELLNGDIAIGFTNIVQETYTDNVFGTEMERTRTVPHINIYLGVKDKKVLKTVLEKSGMQAQDGLYTIPIPFVATMFMAEGEDGLFISTVKANAEAGAKNNQLSDGKFETVGNIFDANSSAMFMQLDESKAPKELTDMIKSNMRKDYDVFQTAIAPFNDLKSWGGNKSSIMELTMADQGSNSLLQIRKMGEQLMEKVEQKRAEEKKQLEEYKKQLEMEDDAEEAEEEEIEEEVIN